MSKKTTLPQTATFLAAIIWAMATRPAHAYLDPGTGSYLFQIALASLFGVVFAVKTFWLQIKSFVAGLMGKTAPAVPTAKPEEKGNS